MEYSWKNTCSTPFYYYVYGKIKEGVLNKKELDTEKQTRIQELVDKMEQHSTYHRQTSGSYDPMQFLHYFKHNTVPDKRKDYDAIIEKYVVQRILNRQWSRPDKPWNPTIDVVEASRDQRFISNCQSTDRPILKCKFCDKTFRTPIKFVQHLWTGHQKAYERSREVWDDGAMDYVTYTEQWIPPNSETYDELSNTFKYDHKLYRPEELAAFEHGSWQSKQ
jgi:hypothetical protein